MPTHFIFYQSSLFHFFKCSIIFLGVNELINSFFVLLKYSIELTFFEMIKDTSFPLGDFKVFL